MSNAGRDTPWPKLLRLKQRVESAVVGANSVEVLMRSAFAALADPRPAADSELPVTGVPLELERQLSPAFIRIEVEAGVYGTRCSTLIIVERAAIGSCKVYVVERRFATDGGISGESLFDFEPDSAD